MTLPIAPALEKILDASRAVIVVGGAWIIIRVSIHVWHWLPIALQLYREGGTKALFDTADGKSFAKDFMSGGRWK